MRFTGFLTPHRKAGFKRRPWSVASLLAIALFGFSALSACAPSFQTHGHSLDDEQVAKIEPGTTSRQEVLGLLGSPSALSTFDDAAWYYVSQLTEKRSFYQEGVVDQDVVTIRFDDQNRVAAVERHGLEQVAEVDPVDRVTPTAGSSPSVMKQLIGNIGRFSNSGSADGPYDPDS